MRVRKLTLWGFTAYKDKVTIDFSDLSVFVITGPNGAGKSSLVESILFALYGKSPRAEKGIGSLVSQDANEMGVDLEFHVGEELYKVYRVYRKNTKGKVLAHTVELRRWKDDKWIMVSSKSKEVTGKIESILGMNYLTFTRAVIIPQNMFDKFLKPEKPKERRDVLITLLGLSIYEKIRELAREERRRVEGEFRRFEGRWEGIRDVSDEKVREIEREIKKLSLSLLDKEREIDKLTKDIEKLKELYDREKQFEKVERELNDLMDKKDNFQKLKERIKKAEDVKFLAPKLLYIEEREKIVQKKREFLSKDENKVKKKEILLKNLRHKREEFVKEYENLSLYELVEIYKKKRDSYIRILERISDIEDIYNDFMSLSEQIKKYKSTLSLKVTKYKEGYIAYRKLKKEFEDMKRLEQDYYAAKVSRTLKKGDRCPVCGGIYEGFVGVGTSELDVDLDLLREKVYKKGLEIEKMKGDISNLVFMIKEKEEQKIKKKEVLGEFKKYVYEESGIDISGKALKWVETFIKNKKKKIERQIEDIRMIEGDISKLDAELEILRGKVYEEREEIEEIEKDIEKWRLEFENALHQKGYKEFEDIKEYMLSDDEIEKLKSKEVEYTNRLSYLQEKKKELIEFLKGEKGFGEILAHKQEEYKREFSHLDSMKAHLALLKNTLDRLKEELEEKREIKKKMEDLQVKLGIYNTILQDLQSDKLPDYIVATIMDTLFEKASENLDILSQGRYTLQIDEDDNVVIIDNWNGGEKRSVDTLSGGEMFATSLSLAISLRELVRGKGILDTFFIDEGFGALDKETREKVVDVLGALSETGNLVGIITHVEELAMNFPVGFKIYKSPQGSHVEVISPTS